MDLKLFQDQVAHWAKVNFDTSNRGHSLYGLMEELAELVSASYVGTRPDAIDAVGDIMIFLADYCGRNGIDISRADMFGSKVPGYHTEMNFVEGMVMAVGALSKAYLKREQGIRQQTVSYTMYTMQGVSAIIQFLKQYCRSADIDFDDAVMETWEMVRQRNWKENPETGGSDGED